MALLDRVAGRTKRSWDVGLVEYGLTLVLVTVVVAITLVTMGHAIENVFSNVALAMQGVSSA